MSSNEKEIRVLIVKQANGSEWAVPVDVIARSRAEHYAKEFDGDVERSLAEDTEPLFASDEYEIEDWAANNMNWSDVAAHAFQIKPPTECEFQEAWINGEKSVGVARVPALTP